jgi:virginiamycin A acetyltransferase
MAKCTSNWLDGDWVASQGATVARFQPLDRSTIGRQLFWMSDSMKSIVRSVMLGASIVAIAPLLVAVWVFASLVGWKRAFESGAQWVAIVPGNLGNSLRSGYYFCGLKSFDPSAKVCMGSVICDPRSEIGRHVYIGTYCEFGWVRVGDDTLIASRVIVPSGKRIHGFDRLDVPIRMQAGTPEQVEIGEDCWIGSGAVVMCSVGMKTVVGAGSVVVKPVPEKVVCGGNPARVLRVRDGSGRGGARGEDSGNA